MNDRTTPDAFDSKERAKERTLLLMSSSGGGAAALKTLLIEEGIDAGFRVIAGGHCRHLVRQFQACEPDQIVVFAPANELCEAMAEWGGAPPCAVSWVSSSASPDEIERLLGVGVTGWWSNDGASLAQFAAGLHWDRLRWQREAAAIAERAQVQTKLDERKWLERAKGILSQARGLSEDEAFKLLRGTAMHANLKIADVSRSVVDASAWAETVNRAGQLRMLSQRLIKLAAQRLAGVDAIRAKALQEESLQRVQANLDHLALSAQLAKAGADVANSVAHVQAAWAAMKATLAQRLSAASLQQADGHADALLTHAEALVAQLESASNRQTLRIINLCGRQRMLTQRVTKQALLAELTEDDARQPAWQQAASEFEAALAELEHAPLSSTEIRQALDAARSEWLRLSSAIRSHGSTTSRLTCSRASEELLSTFDDLTTLYEHSVQVIMS